jgi:hypothetical protein
MYYYDDQFSNASDQLMLLVNGGKTEDGKQDIAPVQLIPDPRIAEYYYTYGLSLVKQKRCSEALPVLQLILSKDPSDETAVFNAQEGLRLCSESIGTTPSPAPAQEMTPTP